MIPRSEKDTNLLKKVADPVLNTMIECNDEDQAYLNGHLEIRGGKLLSVSLLDRKDAYVDEEDHEIPAVK